MVGQNRAVRADHGTFNAARAGLGPAVDDIEIILAHGGCRLGKCRFKRAFLWHRRLTDHDLRQTALIFILVVAALFIDFQKAIKHHNLPRRAQTNLRVR